MLNKKMSRREFLSVSAATSAAAILAACAPKLTATQAPTTAPGGPAATMPPGGPTVTPATAALKYKGEIQFWDWNYAPRQTYFKQLIGEWQGMHPGITINYTTQEWADTGTKLLTAASSNNAPPMSNVWSGWRGDMQRAGYLLPYPEDLLPFDKLASTPFMRDPTTGRIYSCTFLYFCDQLYLNTELLSKEGIKLSDVPKKWDDYFKMCQQLTKYDNSGKLVQAGMTLNHYYSQEWLWQTLVYQLGGWQWSEDGQQAIWNSAEGVEALQMIKDVYQKYKLDDPAFLNLFDAFGTGVAATYISQGYTGASIDAGYPQVAGKWTTQPTPTFTGSLPDHAWGVASPEEGLGVFKGYPADESDACFDFIKYALGPDDHALTWAEMELGPCDRIDLLSSPSLLQHDYNYIIATQAVTLPWRINYGERPLEAEKYWRAMFESVILKNEDAKTALDTATNGVNAELKIANKKRLITERSYKQPGADAAGSAATIMALTETPAATQTPYPTAVPPTSTP